MVFFIIASERERPRRSKPIKSSGGNVTTELSCKIMYVLIIKITERNRDFYRTKILQKLIPTFNWHKVS